MIVQRGDVKLLRGRDLPHLAPPPREQSVTFLLDERCQFVQIMVGHLTSDIALALSTLGGPKPSLAGQASDDSRDASRLNRSSSFWYWKPSARRRSPWAMRGVAGFNLLDPGQQLVQVRRDDGLAHRVDEFLRLARQGIECELDRFLGLDCGMFGVDVLHSHVGVNLLE